MSMGGPPIPMCHPMTLGLLDPELHPQALGMSGLRLLQLAHACATGAREGQEMWRVLVRP